MNTIDIENLTFSYKKNHNFHLKIPKLSIKKKSRIFIEGPSGSGKTTFLNLLTGLILPQYGDININNISIS
mgnify:CR=1 FL=1